MPVLLPLYVSVVLEPAIGFFAESVYFSVVVAVWSKSRSAVSRTSAWPEPTTRSSISCSEAATRFS